MRPQDGEPDLYASDIPFGRGGLSVGAIEVGDEASYRLVACEALRALAHVTTRLNCANSLNVRLREELRLAVGTPMQGAR